jgi:hypothetical protein
MLFSHITIDDVIDVKKYKQFSDVQVSITAAADVIKSEERNMRNINVIK